jgi:fluoride ion exporter CrcB/FEX
LTFGILLAVFLGGTTGSLARYLVWLGIEQAGVSLLVLEVVATAIVNIAGASFLGFVHSNAWKLSVRSKIFWGSGFAGGFTTMSGLAVITAGTNLGLSGIGYLYWLAVASQLVVGILAYWFIRARFEKSKGSVS